MSDSRWLEIERDMQDGAAHLERAIALSDGTDMAGGDLRAFRHVAMHSYAHFRPDKAALAADAARRVLPVLDPPFQAFKRLIEPD